jgi:transcriptional regulator with XRE-family HTH domain
MPYLVAGTFAGMPPIKAPATKPAAPGSAAKLAAPRKSVEVTAAPVLTVGDRVRACREAKRLKKADVARALKVSQAAVGDWESGKTNSPTGENLLNMRDALGYNIEYIVRGKGMPLLPNFEEMARETALISIFRDLAPGPKQSLLDIAQQLRRAHGGGPTDNDPFLRDAPRNPGNDD